MADVLEINDLDDLADFRPAWHALLPNTPRASFFHTPEWPETYWRHFGDDQKLRIVVLREERQVVGIVPLCVRRERYQVGDVDVLTYPLDNWGMWYGPIGSDPARLLARALDHVHSAPRDWHLIDLRWSDAATCRSLPLAPQPYQTTSVIELAGGWEAFLESKPRKVRCEIRRILRRFADRADVQHIRFRPAANANDNQRGADYYEMCTRIAARSWQAHVTDGNTLSHAVVAPFLRDAHQASARAGMVDLNLLLVGRRPAAFLYNYLYAGRLVCLRTGFDPTIGIDGLGTALFLLTIRDSFQRRDNEIDLGPGDQRFKRRWRTRSDTNHRLTYHAPLSLSSQAVRLSQWFKRHWRRGEAAANLSA